MCNCDIYAMYGQCKHTRKTQAVVPTVQKLNQEIENLKTQLAQRDETIAQLRDNLSNCAEEINTLQFMVSIQD